MRNIKFFIPTDSNLTFKINYNDSEYILDRKHPVQLSFDEQSIEFHITQLTVKVNILNILCTIVGILIAPIVSLLFLSFPTFYDGLNPLLVKGKYIFTPDSSNNEILLKLQESRYNGKKLVKPNFSVNYGKLDIIEETYEINHRDIRNSILFCTYSIGIFIFLGLILLIFFAFSVSNLAVKIVSFALLIPLILISLISNIISIVKKRTQLYRELSNIKNIKCR